VLFFAGVQRYLVQGWGAGGVKGSPGPAAPAASVGAKPTHFRIGSRGYFANRGSSALRAHRQHTAPRADSTRRPCAHVAQRPPVGPSARVRESGRGDDGKVVAQDARRRAPDRLAGVLVEIDLARDAVAR